MRILSEHYFWIVLVFISVRLCASKEKEPEADRMSQVHRAFQNPWCSLHQFLKVPARLQTHHIQQSRWPQNPVFISWAPQFLRNLRKLGKLRSILSLSATGCFSLLHKEQNFSLSLFRGFIYMKTNFMYFKYAVLRYNDGGRVKKVSVMICPIPFCSLPPFLLFFDLYDDLPSIYFISLTPVWIKNSTFILILS